MKREKIRSCLSAGVLAFCLGFGGVACMVTGLELPVEWFALCFGCALGAVVAALCYCFKRGGAVLGGIGGVYALVLLMNERFWEQFKALCFSAFSYYNFGYGIPIPDWMEGQTADTQVLPLLLIAGLVMTAAAWTVMRRKRAWLAVTVSLLPLVTCLVVTNTVPEVFALVILLSGLVLLMMTQSVRRQNESHGNRLTAILALPVAAALILLTVAVPPEGYNAPERTESLMRVFDWFATRLPFVGQTSEGELVVSMGGEITDEVDLSVLGRRDQKNTPVMEVVTDASGLLYLRGRDYDRYDGRSWKASEDRIEEGFGPPENWTQNAGQLSLRTLGRRDVLYTPYYQTEQPELHGGRVPNDAHLTEYSYQCRSLRNNWQLLWQMDYLSSFDLIVSTEPPADVRYLELPEQTREQAAAIINDIVKDSAPDNKLKLAQAIGAYVRNSANYDLDTQRMPENQTDFAMWFLRESDTGYCVHFASAATVLLRAAGIPARYVEGYVTEVRAGETAVIRERMAHAWVEYYLERVGWVTLDPTPDIDGEEEETTEPWEETTEATRPTQPETTAPPSEESTARPTAGTTQPATQSTGGSSGGNEEKSIPDWFKSVLRTLVWIAVLALLTVGQWILRRYLKLRRMYRGRANAQALARFREAKLVARLWKIPLPDELLSLAEKAKFSQHALTKEELGRFDAFLREGVGELRTSPWYYRFACRFVFAVY